MASRPQWGTRTGFIIAAVGSAVGLGNIWRFPAVAFENGGGSFFLPYLFALFTAGIPLLILEYSLGHKYRSSAPLTFAKLNKNAEWIGWWQVLIAFIISTYYSIIIAWAMNYTVFAANLRWGQDTETFFYHTFLQLSEKEGQIGGLVSGLFLSLVLTWTIVFLVLIKGIKRGIELANRVFIIALLLIFMVIVIRAITLPGAAAGLNEFFKPEWSSLLNGKVWVAAYSQIFFSLSVAFAIMITYSSYLPKKSDITNNAFIIGFANSSFELLAGIGVFSVLGYMAFRHGLEVPEVVTAGAGLAFVVFPQIINTFTSLNGLFGTLFFLSLALVGITSLISIVEAYVAAISEKFAISRTKAALASGGLAAVISLLYITQGGLYIIDVVDYFINSFGVALSGLVEVLVVVWIVRQLKPLQAHVDAISEIKLGWWWRFSLSVVTPTVLGYMMIDNIRVNLIENYNGYETSFIIAYGWLGAALLALIVGFLFTLKRWQPQQYDN